MNEENSLSPVTADLLQSLEDAAVSAARDIISGRRIIDVEGAYGIGLTTVEVGNDDKCRETGPEEASAVVSRALPVPMIYRHFAVSKRRIASWQEMGQPQLTLSCGGRRPGCSSARRGIHLSRSN